MNRHSFKIHVCILLIGLCIFPIPGFAQNIEEVIEQIAQIIPNPTLVSEDWKQQLRDLDILTPVSPEPTQPRDLHDLSLYFSPGLLAIMDETQRGGLVEQVSDLIIVLEKYWDKQISLDNLYQTFHTQETEISTFIRGFDFSTVPPPGESDPTATPPQQEYSYPLPTPEQVENPEAYAVYHEARFRYELTKQMVFLTLRIAFLEARLHDTGDTRVQDAVLADIEELRTIRSARLEGRELGPDRQIPAGDLEIVNITEEWKDEANTTYTVSYTIRNNGNFEIPEGHSVSLTVDGTDRDQKTVPIILASGDTHSDTFDTIVTLSDEADQITVCADIQNEVEELDEENNCVTVHLSKLEATKTQHVEDQIPETPVPDVNPGDVFSYLITATNMYDYAVYLGIYDALDEYLEYETGTFEVNGVTASDTYFSENILDYQYAEFVNPGQTLTLAFDVSVKDMASHDWLIENMALITAYTGSFDPSGILVTVETNRTQVRVEVIPEPSLLISFGTGLVIVIFVLMRRRRTKRI